MSQTNSDLQTKQEYDAMNPARLNALLHLTAAQRGKLARNFEELLGDGGAPDETADEMVATIREWRAADAEGNLE